MANKINSKEDTSIGIRATDATILDEIHSMVVNKKIKSLYIPIVTVNKATDGNFPV